MSVRKEINEMIYIGNGEKVLEDATVYVTDEEEAKTVSTVNLRLGSILVVIRTGKIYLLDDDGGRWRLLADGSELA